MAVPVVASSATSTADASAPQITVTMASGITAGDVLYIVATHDSNSGVITYDTPSGWTLEDFITGATAGCTAYLFSRRATGSEGASVVLTLSGTAGRFTNAACLRVTGVDSGVTDLTHKYAEADNASSTSQATSSITTTEADCLILSAFVTDNTAADSMAAAGGETEVVDFQNAGLNGMVLGVYSSAKATAGSVSHSVTLNGAAPALALIWAIQAGTAAASTAAGRMLMGVG